MTLVLPWPPSVNKYWRRVGAKTILSAAAREYRANVAAEAQLQGAPRLGDARLRVEILAFPPDRRVRDLDNLTKAVLDALAYARVFEDDGQVDDLRVRRSQVYPPGRLAVDVEVLS